MNKNPLRSWYDISTPISPRLQVWPGDVAFSRQMQSDTKRGDRTTTSSLRATVHLGTHADAPSHYGVGGTTIDRQPLDLYVGECQVIRVTPSPGSLILPDQIQTSISTPRVLLATGTFPDYEHWNHDFAALSPELIAWLKGQGVRLVGVDTPSVDLFGSTKLETHDACFRHDIAILEGLRLEEVPGGRYELIALPLKLVDFDASPVRAMLRPLGSG